MNKLLLSIAVVIVVVQLASAHRFCKENSDCDPLGNLWCIKSACDWGICACNRGYAAKYIGSEGQFECVPLKKIGERCDTAHDGGICAAAGSACFNGLCQCMSAGTESRWGGEACLNIGAEHYPSESFSTNGIGSCVSTSGGTVTGLEGLSWTFQSMVDANPAELENSVFDNVPNVCACGTGYRTALPNDFASAPYMGRKAPYCVPIRVGDMCISDNDCSAIKENVAGTYTADQAKCTNNVCVCGTANHVEDITGMFCNKALAYGDNCAWSGYTNGDIDVGICDGSAGLRCGDICDVDSWIQATSFNHTCVCDPSYTDSGSSCSAVAAGASCKGDYNCKSMGDNAICMDQTCKDSAALLAVSAITLLLPMLALLRL